MGFMLSKQQWCHIGLIILCQHGTKWRENAVGGAKVLWCDWDCNTFVYIAAFATFLTWLKLLGAMRVLSVKFSLYVVTLLRILSDIRAFLVILFIIIATFASILHILFVGDHGWDENEEEPWRRSGAARGTREPARGAGSTRASVLIVALLLASSLRWLQTCCSCSASGWRARLRS